MRSKHSGSPLEMQRLGVSRNCDFLELRTKRSIGHASHAASGTISVAIGQWPFWKQCIKKNDTSVLSAPCMPTGPITPIMVELFAIVLCGAYLCAIFIQLVYRSELSAIGDTISTTSTMAFRYCALSFATTKMGCVRMIHSHIGEYTLV